MTKAHERKYVSSYDVEIEIAIGDRRAAYDELSRAANWVGGTLLVLNGGAIVAILGRNDLSLEQASPALFVFATGLTAVLILGLFGTVFALELIVSADRRLDRNTHFRLRPSRTKRAVLICVFATLVSAMSFILGTALAFQSVDAQAKAQLQASSAREGPTRKQNS